MPTWVALLRAVNLGPRNKLAMADLRDLLTGLGYGDVRTYVLSGNAVFTSPGGSAAAHERAIEAALSKDLGLDVRVLVRSAAQLKKVVAGLPFTTDDPKALHVVFLSGQPRRGAVAADAYAPDEFAFGDKCVYVNLAHGVQRSGLPNWEKALGLTATMRSIGTVRKLAELANA